MSPMFPVYFVTYVPGCTWERSRKYRCSVNRTFAKAVSGTTFATGWGWASRPAKRNKNRWDWTECGAGSGEIEINHGAIEAEQLCDPERA
jgi:hypothetical protein